MKKVLLIGSGAREHALAEALTRSPQGCELFVYGSARNPGLLTLAAEYQVGSLADLEAMARFAEKVAPDFAVVGPDNPIADGAADALAILDIPSVAPLKTLARLESSKAFARELMVKYGVAGAPKFKVFTEPEGLLEFIQELGDYVVKADGLMGGKGVKVSGEHLATFEDGHNFALECLFADGRVVVEEKFIGQEFSLMSFVDGTHVVDMPVIQDHKRAYEGDTGPNTGGMGTWSGMDGSLPFLTPQDLADAHEITVQMAKALHQETGHLYKGIMYGGFIAVRDGVRLIEYNARFGDPEAMNALTLLKTDFIAICEAIIAGTLDQLSIEFENAATVLKYVVPNGYPDAPIKGEKVQPPSQLPEGVSMYYASVDSIAEGLVLGGSRALAFIAKGPSLDAAEALVEAAASSVVGPVFHRKDIGTAPLIEVRMEQMRRLRN